MGTGKGGGAQVKIIVLFLKFNLILISDYFEIKMLFSSEPPPPLPHQPPLKAFFSYHFLFAPLCLKIVFNGGIMKHRLPHPDEKHNKLLEELKQFIMFLKQF